MSRFVRRGIAFFTTLAFVSTSLAQGSSRGFQAVNKPTLRTTEIPREHYLPKMVKVGGKFYFVSDEQSLSSPMRKHMVVGSDFQEFMIDTDGDGTADIWSVTKGKVRFTVSNPSFGHFKYLETEMRLKKGLMKSKFVLSDDHRFYKLIASRTEPYVVAHAGTAGQNLIIGCSINPGLQSSVNQWLGFLKSISDADKSKHDDAIACFAKRYQNFIFDPTCTSGAYAAGMDAMVKGLAEVMASSSGGTSFLQCLDRNNLATHAALIQQNLMQRVIEVQNALNTAAIGGAAPVGAESSGGSRVQAASLDLGDCSPLPFPANLPVSNKAKLITCGAGDEERGSYVQETDQVRLQATSDTIAADASDASYTCTDPSHAYGMTIFHELIHSSGIMDHPYVDNIEKCCGRPEPDGSDPKVPASKACQAMNSTTNRQRAIQSYYDIFKGVPGYSEFRSSLIDQIGQDRAVAFIDQYSVMLDQNSSASANLYNSCIANGGSTCNTSCESSCLSKYQENIGALTQTFASQQCGALNVQMQYDLKQLDCAKVTADMVKMVNPKLPPGTTQESKNVAGITPNEVKAARAEWSGTGTTSVPEAKAKNSGPTGTVPVTNPTASTGKSSSPVTGRPASSSGSQASTRGPAATQGPVSLPPPTSNTGRMGQATDYGVLSSRDRATQVTDSLASGLSQLSPIQTAQAAPTTSGPSAAQRAQAARDQIDQIPNVISGTQAQSRGGEAIVVGRASLPGQSGSSGGGGTAGAGSGAGGTNLAAASSSGDPGARGANSQTTEGDVGRTKSKGEVGGATVKADGAGAGPGGALGGKGANLANGKTKPDQANDDAAIEKRNLAFRDSLLTMRYADVMERVKRLTFLQQLVDDGVEITDRDGTTYPNSSSSANYKLEYCKVGQVDRFVISGTCGRAGR